MRSRVILKTEDIWTAIRVLGFGSQPLPGSVGSLWTTLYLDDGQVALVRDSGIAMTVEALP